MNKRQKLVQEAFLDNEEVVIKRLKRVYDKALDDIIAKSKELQTEIDGLDKMLNLDIWNDDDREQLQSMKQSKVYQKQYQDALKKQVGSILDNMQVEEFKTVDAYLKQCYENAFIGTMYDLQGQGIPVCFPIDQVAMVRAVQMDSKISQGLYERLGEDITLLKRKIVAQVSRGISTSMSYGQMAKQLEGYTNIGFNNAVRITRTEGHRIQVQSAMDACYKAKDAGADIVKQWDATLDKRTRKSHQEVDGEIRELDEPFSNGLMFPGDPNGGASEVVNCRCALLQRAKWALDDEELETLKERAAYYGLDKSKNFDDFKQKYLKIEKPEKTTKKRNSTKKTTSKSPKTVEKTGGSSKIKAKDAVNTNDSKVFEQNTVQQTGMTKKYLQTLKTKFSGGETNAKKVFNKYVPSDSVIDSNSKKAFFRPSTKRVYMDYTNDLLNKRGAGTTFFHEHGHFIDFMAAGKNNMDYISTSNPLFGQLLRSDFKSYVNKVKKQHNENQSDAYLRISFEIMGDKEHSISDLFGGLTKKKCQGRYGHPAQYWQTAGALEKEAFAHMFEAMFDKEKYQLMDKYFPKAFKEFRDMIEGLI